MGAMDQVRFRSAPRYVAPGQAPDSGGVLGMQYASANASASASGSIGTTGLLVVVLLAIVVVGHLAAK